MSEPSCVAGTLKWCNERRKEKGQKPLDRLPKGAQGDPLSCPCGKATGLSVGTKYYSEFPLTKYDLLIELPVDVLEFVDHFDRGDLPQYLE